MTMSRLVKCDVLNAEESENDVEAYLQRERSNIQASRATGYLPRGTILSVGTSEIDFWFNMQGIGLGEYAGWYICDGRNGTPDLRGRFIIGRDPSNTMMSNAFDQVGLTGGSYSAKLNEKNLPTHSHDVKLTSSSNGAHQHKYVDNVFGNRVTVPNGVGYVYSNMCNYQCSGFPLKEAALNSDTDVSGAHTHLVEGKSGSAGESQPFDIRNPYFVVVYIIYKGIN
jgi:microcystin-dependent protein